MSLVGQNRKNSMRAYVFRCSPNNGHRQDTSACPFRAKRRHNGLNQVAAITHPVLLSAALLACDICGKDCSEVAGRSHFISPAARRMPSMRSVLSSGLIKIKWNEGNPVGHGLIFLSRFDNVFCYLPPLGM